MHDKPEEYKHIMPHSDTENIISSVSQSTDDSPPKGQTEKKSIYTVKLLLTVASVSVGSCSHFGYQSGVLSAPSQVIQEFYNNSHTVRREVVLTEPAMRWLWGATVAILCVGGAFGSVLGGYMSDLIGRKRTLIANNFFSLLAVVFVTITHFANVYELLIVARFFAGVNIGVSLTICGLYIAEITHKDVRGELMVAIVFGMNIGLITAMVLSFYVFNHAYDWAILLALFPALFSLFELLTLPFCPESPRWLLLHKKDEEQARTALKAFGHNTTTVTEEINDMYKEMKVEQKKVGVIQLLKPYDRNPEWNLPLGICIFFGCSAGFYGLNMVWFYSSSILATAGLSKSQISFTAVLLGVDALVNSYIGGKLFDKFGRRPMMIISCTVCGFLMVAFCLTTIFQDAVKWISWISIVIIFVFAAIFCYGPGPAAFVICPELWSQGPRQAAINITMQGWWWSTFLCGQLMPILQASIGGYTFLIFAAVLFASAIFVYIYLPETNKTSFGETTEYFRRNTIGEAPLPYRRRKIGLGGTFDAPTRPILRKPSDKPKRVRSVSFSGIDNPALPTRRRSLGDVGSLPNQGTSLGDIGSSPNQRKSSGNYGSLPNRKRKFGTMEPPTVSHLIENSKPNYGPVIVDPSVYNWSKMSLKCQILSREFSEVNLDPVSF